MNVQQLRIFSLVLSVLPSVGCGYSIQTKSEHLDGLLMGSFKSSCFGVAISAQLDGKGSEELVVVNTIDKFRPSELVVYEIRSGKLCIVNKLVLPSYVSKDIRSSDIVAVDLDNDGRDEIYIDNGSPYILDITFRNGKLVLGDLSNTGLPKIDRMCALRKSPGTRKTVESDCLVFVGEKRNNTLDYPGVPLQVAYILGKPAGKWKVLSEKELPTITLFGDTELFDRAKVICTMKQRCLFLYKNRYSNDQPSIIRIVDIDSGTSETQYISLKYRPLQKLNTVNWKPNYLEYMTHRDISKILSVEDVANDRFNMYSQDIVDKVTNYKTNSEYYVSKSCYDGNGGNTEHVILELLDYSQGEYIPRYWCYGKLACKLKVASTETALVLEDEASGKYSNYRVVLLKF